MTDTSTEGLRLTRTLAATPDRVYAAFTEPKQFAAWFGTEAVDVPLDSLVLDAREGGQWRATMVLPDGATIHWVGEYVEVDPPSALAFTITDDDSNPQRDVVRASLTAVDGGSELVLTQSGGGLSPEEYEQTAVGWNGFLDALEAVL